MGGKEEEGGRQTLVKRLRPGANMSNARRSLTTFFRGDSRSRWGGDNSQRSRGVIKLPEPTKGSRIQQFHNVLRTALKRPAQKKNKQEGDRKGGKGYTGSNTTETIGTCSCRALQKFSVLDGKEKRPGYENKLNIMVPNGLTPVALS